MQSRGPGDGWKDWSAGQEMRGGEETGTRSRTSVKDSQGHQNKIKYQRMIPIKGYISENLKQKQETMSKNTKVCKII